MRPQEMRKRKAVQQPAESSAGKRHKQDRQPIEESKMHPFVARVQHFLQIPRGRAGHPDFGSINEANEVVNRQFKILSCVEYCPPSGNMSSMFRKGDSSHS